jgi:hypothetical protein
MVRINSRHPRFPAPLVRRAVSWASRQIGLPAFAARRLTIEVGFRRNQGGRGSWGGYYRHRTRTVLVLLPREPVAYPQSLAHSQAERGREANDELELFVSILAHELEHARVAAVAVDVSSLRKLNYEPRVRDVAWRAVLAFRSRRPGFAGDTITDPRDGESRPLDVPSPPFAAATRPR